MRSLAVIFMLCLFTAAGITMAKLSPRFPQSTSFSSLASNNSARRDPAAIRKVYDFSELEGSALDQASKQRLISGAKIYAKNNNVGIELGHFVVRGADGQKYFACQEYSKIILEFEGDGMISAGHKPKMEVEGACDVSADINSISPLWIPVAKILGEPVASGEFDYQDGNPIKIRFSNVSDEWPSLWRLKSIRLVSSMTSQKEVTILDKDILQYSERPLILKFKE